MTEQLDELSPRSTHHSSLCCTVGNSLQLNIRILIGKGKELSQHGLNNAREQNHWEFNFQM